MKSLSLFKKTKKIEKSGGFSDFFLYTSGKKIERILKKVAHEANKEQREIFKKAGKSIR